MFVFKHNFFQVDPVALEGNSDTRDRNDLRFRPLLSNFILDIRDNVSQDFYGRNLQL